MPNFYANSANVGQIVPFSIEYVLVGSNLEWTENIFETSFSYNINGTIDFTHPVPVPSTMMLLVVGLAAIARYGRNR